MLWMMSRLLAVAAAAEALAATTVRVMETPTYDELERCTVCMVNGFWGSDGLDDDQRLALGITQLGDLDQRFGGASSRRLRGSLVAALDDGEAVVGMVSLELGLFDGARPSVLPRDEAEERFMEKMGELSAQERDGLRKAPLNEVCATLFGDAVRVAPLLANLAVLPSGRRQGLGKRLVDACVEIAQDWGYDELLLEVESTNAPAVALYEDRLGFQELWRAPRPALEVDASIASGPPLRRRDAVDHVAMRLPL